MTRNTLFVFALTFLCGPALAAFEALPKGNLSLQGTWQVNSAASDDVDKLIAELIKKEDKERRQWRKHMEEVDPYSVPDAPPDADPAYRRKQEKELRSLLGVTKTLNVKQSGATVEIASDIETRRFEAGSTSQSSMRNGDLADMKVGWDGEWFVIDRKVPGRLHQVEKLRLIQKTGQLEYVSKWSGDDDLSGVKLRRVFDAIALEPTPEDANVGPVR